VVGLLTGSLGILAEAAHSGLDLVAAFITFLAVRVSDRLADVEHPYGHGKVESFSAFIETLLLLVTCAWIIYEAIQRLFFRSVEIEANVYAFGIMVLSIAIDFSRSRALYRVARKYHSQALEADALHFSTDIWSSTVVIGGLVLVRVGELIGQRAIFSRADALAALVVAMIVIYVSLQLGKRTVDVLIDRAPTGLPDQIRAVAQGVDGVLDCHHLRVRRAGSSIFVDMTLHVDRNLPLEKAHTISTTVEEHVQELIPNADVVIHIEPVEGENETVVDRIRAIAGGGALSVHDVRVHDVKGQLYVNLHLEVDGQLDLKQAHQLASQLEEDIRTQIPHVAEISTHIEPASGHAIQGRDVREKIPFVRDAMAEVAQEVGFVRDYHDVRVREAQGKLFVSMHCVFDEKLAVEDAHQASSMLESRLKERISNLERVLVHVEPA
jgi:cation diffusion facilitator family transporter